MLVNVCYSKLRQEVPRRERERARIDAGRSSTACAARSIARARGGTGGHRADDRPGRCEDLPEAAARRGGVALLRRPERARDRDRRSGAVRGRSSRGCTRRRRRLAADARLAQYAPAAEVTTPMIDTHDRRGRSRTTCSRRVGDEIPVPADGPDNVLDVVHERRSRARRTRRGSPKPIAIVGRGGRGRGRACIMVPITARQLDPAKSVLRRDDAVVGAGCTAPRPSDQPAARVVGNASATSASRPAAARSRGSCEPPTSRDRRGQWSASDHGGGARRLGPTDGAKIVKTGRSISRSRTRTLRVAVQPRHGRRGRARRLRRRQQDDVRRQRPDRGDHDPRPGRATSRPRSRVSTRSPASRSSATARTAPTSPVSTPTCRRNSRPRPTNATRSSWCCRTRSRSATSSPCATVSRPRRPRSTSCRVRSTCSTTRRASRRSRSRSRRSRPTRP